MSKIITGLLVLLGFGVTQVSCIMYGSPQSDEYGSPHADFEIKGRVTDVEGDPVGDIKIVVSDLDADFQQVELAEGTTDANGDYVVTGGWYGGLSLMVTATDIDGEANGGEFPSRMQGVEIEKYDYVGGDDSWYLGKVTKTADFILGGENAIMYGVRCVGFEPKPRVTDGLQSSIENE